MDILLVSNIMKKLILVVLISGGSMAACTQWFDPRVDAPGNVLVVEGLLTDGPSPYFVKLSLTAAYGQDRTYEAVEQASVLVRNQHKETIVFNETTPGLYISPDGFRGVAGDTYILYVETPDGESYRSAPQTIASGPEVEQVGGRFGVMEMPVENNRGEVSIEGVEGVSFFADIRHHHDSFPRMRFETQLYLQYLLQEADPPDPSNPLYMYCQRKLALDRKVNVALPSLEQVSGSALRHELAFMPQTIRFFPGMEDWVLRHVDRRAVVLRQFSLNEESYVFYRTLHDQMSAEGRIFDPVAAQIQGNILCLSTPGKLVMGHFEASALRSSTHVLNPEPVTANRLDIRPSSDLDHLPMESHCFLERRPETWIITW